MEEMKLESISKVEKSVSQNFAVQSARQTADDVSVEQKDSHDEEMKTQESQRGYSLKDVELKFDVDNDTDEVTVFVLDKSSRSVLRTIPPEELRKLDAGDLLELTA